MTKAQARCLALKKSLLSEQNLPGAEAGVLDTLDGLGYVQIDTINVVARSHHIVFQSRCPDYTPKYLRRLHVSQKKVFEHWAHAASYIPMSDYRFYRRSIESRPKAGSWVHSWAREHRLLIREVRRRIEREGPLGAADFKERRKSKSGGWWDWKPSKMALEVLFWQGELMVSERKNFHKIYDLPERVLPEDVATTLPSEEEEQRFFVKKALGALGVASQQEISGYIKVSGRLHECVARMVQEGEILEVKITGLDKQYYILRSDLVILDRRAQGDEKVRLLSPFDNAIILRDRTSGLFDFDYKLECYVPRKQRRYGYFSLPILWRRRFVGRVDPKADRKRRVLVINNLTFEQNDLDSRAFLPELSATLHDFAHFNDCDDIELTPHLPSSLKQALT